MFITTSEYRDTYLKKKSDYKVELLCYLRMLAAFAFIAYGISAMIRADVGVAPWDVLHLGLSLQLKYTYGKIIQMVGLILIIISWILGIRPHLGTILNMYFIGPFVDIFIGASLVPQPGHLALQLLQLAVGTVIFAYGTASYILINRGTGPRDSFMLALSKRTGLRVGLTRTFIEIGTATGGYLLGGPLGVGTVIFAFSVGPLLELFFIVEQKQIGTLNAFINKKKGSPAISKAASNGVKK